MPLDSPRELLDVEETAEFFRTSVAALYSQRHRGEAPGALAVKVGRKLLWRRSDLEAWWERRVLEVAG